jgi:hypothetical protein
VAASQVQIGMSHLSTQYVLVPISVTIAGEAYNPTADTAQMAFMPTATQVPQSADWQTASWITDTSNILYPYSVQCLVGPLGTINLGIGNYVLYVKLVDSPEVPVLLCGYLQIS